ncbi:MAG: hypothetical protein JSR59_21510 [Proteobacteria bacterium]|nr:hypothetical protein [Pseudomonadota bacterium]
MGPIPNYRGAEDDDTLRAWIVATKLKHRLGNEHLLQKAAACLPREVLLGKETLRGFLNGTLRNIEEHTELGKGTLWQYLTLQHADLYAPRAAAPNLSETGGNSPISAQPLNSAPSDKSNASEASPVSAPPPASSGKRTLAYALGIPAAIGVLYELVKAAIDSDDEDF